MKNKCKYKQIKFQIIQIKSYQTRIYNSTYYYIYKRYGQEEHSDQDDDYQVISQQEQIYKGNDYVENNHTQKEKEQKQSNQYKKNIEQVKYDNQISINKQNYDTNTINFHEEQFNKQQLLYKEELHYDQRFEIIDYNKNNLEQKLFQNIQLSKELSNIIVEGSSNSTHLVQIMSFKSDEIKNQKTERENQQNEYEIFEDIQKTKQHDNEVQAISHLEKKQFSQEVIVIEKQNVIQVGDKYITNKNDNQQIQRDIYSNEQKIHNTIEIEQLIKVNTNNTTNDQQEFILYNQDNEQTTLNKNTLLSDEYQQSDLPQINRYKSTDNGGNFIVSQMLQIQQQQNENSQQVGGGFVTLGRGISENYSYISPEIIIHQEKKCSSPDIMDIDFSSSNQTSSFGFSKISVDKVQSQDDNDQNNIKNDGNKNLRIISIDSQKQSSSNNSYELTFQIQVSKQINDPFTIQENKEDIKLPSNEDIRKIKEDHDFNSEQIEIIQQEQNSELNKHLYQPNIDKIDLQKQHIGQSFLSINVNQDEIEKNKKQLRNNDVYFIEEQSASPTINLIFQKSNLQYNKPSENENQLTTNDLKDNDLEQSQYINNVYLSTYQNLLSSNNEDKYKSFTQFQSNESLQFKNDQRNKRSQQQTIQINEDQLIGDSSFLISSRDESQFSMQTREQIKQQIQKDNNVSQNDYWIENKVINNSENNRKGLNTSISLSNLNNMSIRWQNNQQMRQQTAQIEVKLLTKIIILFNCVQYGYLIPYYPKQFDFQTRLLISLYIFVFQAIKQFQRRQIIIDLAGVYQIVLATCNLLLNQPQYQFIINYLFFGQFLISIWNLNQISTRMRNVINVINSSFKPNLEILGFLLFLILIFNVIFNVFNLTQVPNSIFSFNSFEYLKYYVLSQFDKDPQFKQTLDLKFEPYAIYFSYFCSFICLFFMKIVVENILTIVQKVSQEQYYVFVNPHYSCGKLAIFKENQKIKKLYSMKLLYLLIQTVYMIIHCIFQYINECRGLNIQNSILELILVCSRYSSLFFITYELLIDTLLSNPITMCKNIIYLFVILEPQFYGLFFITLFYGMCSYITYFKLLFNYVEMLILDFGLIVLINYSVYLSYTHCEQSRQISYFIPLIIQFFITIPFLKAMSIRYLQMYVTQNDEGAIFTSLNIQSNQSLQIDENYESFGKQLNQDQSVIEIEQINQEMKFSQQINSPQPNLFHEQNYNDKSFFIFSKANLLRIFSMKMIKAKLFCQIQDFLMLILGIKEFFYFLCQVFSISYNSESFIFISLWENYIEPSLLGLIILTKSISFGFIFQRESFLRSTQNLLFFILFVIVYGLQQFSNKYHFGFLRVIYLLFMLPFGIKSLSQITFAINRAQKIIFQILFIFCNLFLILVFLESSQINTRYCFVLSYINQLIYFLSISLFTGVILAEFSTYQFKHQNSDTIWINIKKKISNHKFNFQYVNQKQNNSKDSILSIFLKRSDHNIIISVITGLYYAQLFLIGIIEQYLQPNQQLSDFLSDYQSIVISGFTYFVIIYCIIHISVLSLIPFLSSSSINKVNQIIYDQILIQFFC